MNRKDRLHLEAAEGWLELGNWNEANAELEEITPEMRAHPDGLCVRFRVYEAAGRWEEASELASTLCKLRPDQGLPCAYLARAVNGLGNTQGAIDFLVNASRHFPMEPAIPYEIACYCCHLSQLKEAREWLKRAIEVSGTPEIKMRALLDERLSPIWKDMD